MAQPHLCKHDGVFLATLDLADAKQVLDGLAVDKAVGRVQGAGKVELLGRFFVLANVLL